VSDDIAVATILLCGVSVAWYQLMRRDKCRTICVRLARAHIRGACVVVTCVASELLLLRNLNHHRIVVYICTVLPVSLVLELWRIARKTDTD